MTKSLTKNQYSDNEGTALAVPSHQNITVTPVGLVIEGDITFDDWAVLGPVLGKYNRGVAWAVGDWLTTGEHRFGEMYSQAIDTTGLSLGRLRNLKSLADRVPYINRVEGLSLSHHEAVAPLSHDLQKVLLAIAVAEGLDRDEMRRMAAEAQHKPGLEEWSDYGPDDEDEEQEVIDPPLKPDLDRVLYVARKVITAWASNPTGVTSMSLTEVLIELEELIGVPNA